jgi:hypothetical protein
MAPQSEPSLLEPGKAFSAYIRVGVLPPVQQTEEAMRQGTPILFKVHKVLSAFTIAVRTCLVLIHDRLGAVCVYDRLQRRRLFSSQHVFSLDAPSMSLVPLRLSYPVESKSYIPSLVHSCMPPPFQCRQLI